MNIEPFLTFFQCPELEYDPPGYKWYCGSSYEFSPSHYGKTADELRKTTAWTGAMVPGRAVLLEGRVFGWNDQ